MLYLFGWNIQHWWCVYSRWTWLLSEHHVFNGQFMLMFKSCVFLYVWSFYIFVFVCIFYMLFKPHLIDMKFIFIFSSSFVWVLYTEMLRKSFFGDIFRYSRITWYFKRILIVSFYLFFTHTMCSLDLWKHCWTVSGIVSFCFWFLLVKWPVKHKHGSWQFWW